MNLRKLAKSLSSLVLLLTMTVVAFAQTRTVTGRVTNSKGEGIPSATVRVSGGDAGTSTDINGNYSLTVPQNATALIISSVGFGSQTVTISGNQANATLEEATNSLNEVVVIGYGTARKKDLTGAVGSVAAKDFNKGTVTAPDQLIQGKVAGVQVQQNSGAPGAATTVRIRGISSIRSGNSPLFVIDGVPLSGSAVPGVSTEIGGAEGQNPLNFINPNDIASIDVLKDASSTAIYGSRGANGVVMITTKKGLSGSPRLEVGSSFGFSSAMKRYKVLNASEYRNVLKDYGLTTADFGSNVDAFKEITQPGFSTYNQNVAFSGGNENGRYRFSMGYMDQKGLIKETGLKKYTANFSGGFKFLDSKKLGLDVNLLASKTNLQSAPISTNAGAQGNLLGAALAWNPTASLAWTKEQPIDPKFNSNDLINPMALLGAWDDRDNIISLLANITPYFKITNDLEYRLTLSANYSAGERRTEIRRWTNLINIKDYGWAQIGTQNMLNTQMTHTLTYNKQITDFVGLNALAGYEYLNIDNRGYGQQGRQFIDYPNLRYTDYMQNVPNARQSQWAWNSPVTQLQSVFGRVNFNFGDRYILTGTVRRDGSTKFGANNKYGTFPSVAAAWNVINEDFMKGTMFDNLKIRGSWGQTGNQEFPSAASLMNTNIGQGTNLTTSTYPNPDLVWETNTMSNIGADFGFFRNRLNGSFDFFQRKTTDALFQPSITQPGPPGGTFWTNLDGDITNRGFEFSLNGGIIRTDDLQWNVAVNAAFVENKINGLGATYNTGGLHGQGMSGASSQRLADGYPMNVFYLRNYQGLDKDGFSIYEDEGLKLFYSKSPNPKTIYGISTDVSYKKFSLNVNANGAGGHYIYNNTLNSILNIGQLNNGRNIAKSLIGGNVKEALANPIAPSTRYLEKGDYLKIANASLSYRIGDVANIFKNAVIAVTGQNLHVFTKFTGFDPEVNTDKSINGIPSQGIEYTPYPTPRNIIFSLNFAL